MEYNIPTNYDEGNDTPSSWTSFMYTLSGRKYEAMERLIKEIDINDSVDSDGNTILMICYYDPDLVKWLIEHGSNPYLRNKLGQNFFDITRGYNIDDKEDRKEILDLLEGKYGSISKPVKK